MPKPLTPEQMDALKANGVIIPGWGSAEVAADTPTMPAGLIQRTLGSTGLPHTVSVERMGEEPNASTSTDVSFESHGNTDFEASYRASYNTVQGMMDLVGETVPDLNDPDLLRQLDKLKFTFRVFKRSGYQPEVVLHPTNRPLDFWVSLANAVQDSPLNPNEPDPDNNGSTRKVLRNGGLYLGANLKNEWNSITNPSVYASPWQVEVISASDKPAITQITGYGYTDTKNQHPHDGLNGLLVELHKSDIVDRTNRNSRKLTLTQPNIHPTAEGYITHQLTRVAQQKAPLDSTTWSWLDGTFTSGGVPVGYWYPGNGQVDLNWNDAGYVDDNLGVRPSAR